MERQRRLEELRKEEEEWNRMRAQRLSRYSSYTTSESTDTGTTNEEVPRSSSRSFERRTDSFTTSRSRRSPILDDEALARRREERRRQRELERQRMEEEERLRQERLEQERKRRQEERERRLREMEEEVCFLFVLNEMFVLVSLPPTCKYE